MNTCDTCKHWGTPSGDDCSWGQNTTGMADCHSPKLEELPNHGICSNYDAPTGGCGFFTGPKFGCVHYEIKP